MSYIERSAEKNAIYILQFPMVDATNPENFLTGETVSITAYHADGTSEANTSFSPADSVSEIGTTGMYQISLSAAEMNHDRVILKFSSTNAQDTMFGIRTRDVASEAKLLAEYILRRDIENVEDSTAAGIDAKTKRSLLWAIAKLVNKTSISGATLTITETDDTTSLFTQTVTSDAAANPVTGLDTV